MASELQADPDEIQIFDLFIKINVSASSSFRIILEINGERWLCFNSGRPILLSTKYCSILFCILRLIKILISKFDLDSNQNNYTYQSDYHFYCDNLLVWKVSFYEIR